MPGNTNLPKLPGSRHHMGKDPNRLAFGSWNLTTAALQQLMLTNQPTLYTAGL